MRPGPSTTRGEGDVLVFVPSLPPQIPSLAEPLQDVAGDPREAAQAGACLNPDRPTDERARWERDVSIMDVHGDDAHLRDAFLIGTVD